MTDVTSRWGPLKIGRVTDTVHGQPGLLSALQHFTVASGCRGVEIKGVEGPKYGNGSRTLAKLATLLTLSLFIRT